MSRATTWKYDAFISYSSDDSVVATDLIAALEAKGLRCWIAPRDVQLGEEYPQEISRAIDESKTFVVLLSRSSIESRHVRSEVEMAANRSSAIFPVRLEAVELTHGMEFLVSLHQWVDLVDGPRAAAYDQLAEAIRSGKAPSGPRGPVPPRPWWRPYAIPAAVVAVLLFGWGLKSASSPTSEPADLEKILAATRDSFRDAATTPMTEDTVKVKFQDWIKSQVQFTISAYRAPQGAGIFYSVDGETFEKYDKAAAIHLEGDGKFVVEMRDAAGEPIARYDRSKELAETLKKAAADSIPGPDARDDQRWGCDVYGCVFAKGKPFCNAYVKRAWLGNSPGERSDEIDLGLCGDVTHVSCHSGVDLSFPLTPGESVHARLEFRDGSRQDFEVPVELRVRNRPDRLGRPFPDGEWRQLTPIAGRNPGGRAPFAAARYEVPSAVVGQFQVFAALSPCGIPGGSQEDTLLLDTDGRGLVGFGRYLGGPFSATYSPGDNDRRFHQNISLGPQVSEIGIALDRASGERLGPYWYRFDAAEVVRDTVARDATPVVACAGESRLRGPRSDRSCVAASPEVAWVNARSVRFGSAIDSWTETIDIDYSADEYLRIQCEYQADCPPFFFEIPAGWTDVFSQITLNNGETLKAVRHVLPQSMGL